MLADLESHPVPESAGMDHISAFDVREADRDHCDLDFVPLYTGNGLTSIRSIDVLSTSSPGSISSSIGSFFLAGCHGGHTFR